MSRYLPSTYDGWKGAAPEDIDPGLRSLRPQDDWHRPERPPVAAPLLVMRPETWDDGSTVMVEIEVTVAGWPRWGDRRWYVDLPDIRVETPGIELFPDERERAAEAIIAMVAEED